MIRKDKNPTASLLFGAAAIQCLIGLVGWSIYSNEFGWLDWVITFAFLIYVVLGLWARWAPVVPAFLGFLLYAVFLLAQACRSVELLKTGWLFKLPMVLVLTTALVCALTFGRKGPSTATVRPGTENSD